MKNMGRREVMRSTILIVLALMSLEVLCFERKAVAIAEARLMSKGCVLNQKCHVEVAEPLDVKDQYKYSNPEDDQEVTPGDDYDKYRQYGDVPSPGVGH
ncbi:hypothetical protein CsatB_009505 [Cannabis sativa]